MKRKTKIKKVGKSVPSKRYIWILGVLLAGVLLILATSHYNFSHKFVLGSSLTPTPTCTPPPPCVNTIPRCLLAQPSGGWCATATSTPNPTVTATLIPPTNTPYPSPTPTSIPSDQLPTPTPYPETFVPTLPPDNSFNQADQGNFSNGYTGNTDSSSQQPIEGGSGIQYNYSTDQTNQNGLQGQNQATNPTPVDNTIQNYPTEALPSIAYEFISPSQEKQQTNPIISLILTVDNSISNFVKSLFKSH